MLNMDLRIQRERLRQFKKECSVRFLKDVSKIFSEKEEIYIKYLFKMNYAAKYRHVLAALATMRTVTESLIIETLFIMKRWKEIELYFSLNVFNIEDCYIVSQFAQIPIGR